MHEDTRITLLHSIQLVTFCTGYIKMHEQYIAIASNTWKMLLSCDGSIEREYSAMNSFESLSRWDKCFQMLHQFLISLLHLKCKYQTSKAQHEKKSLRGNTHLSELLFQTRISIEQSEA